MQCSCTGNRTAKDAPGSVGPPRLVPVTDQGDTGWRTLSRKWPARSRNQFSQSQIPQQVCSCSLNEPNYTVWLSRFLLPPSCHTSNWGSRPARKTLQSTVDLPQCGAGMIIPRLRKPRESKIKESNVLVRSSLAKSSLSPVLIYDGLGKQIKRPLVGSAMKTTAS